MSDNWLRYVPCDPWFQPSASAIARAEVLLRGLLPDAEEISAVSSALPQFVHAGGNWDGVSCSSCGADLASTWSALVDEQYKDGGFSLVHVNLPCCGARSSLNDLRYGWPVAFGRFVLDAKNPNVESLSGETGRLEQVLGCQLREIQVHL
jgi:hypothetical protein